MGSNNLTVNMWTSLAVSMFLLIFFNDVESQINIVKHEQNCVNSICEQKNHHGGGGGIVVPGVGTVTIPGFPNFPGNGIGNGFPNIGPGNGIGNGFPNIGPGNGIGNGFPNFVPGNGIGNINQNVQRPQIVTFYSEGEGGQHAGKWLGQYEYNSQRNFYIQKSTELQNGIYEPRYLFQNHQTRQWWVGPTPDVAKGFLWNSQTSATVPTSGWQVWNSGSQTWTIDNTLTVSFNAFSACAPIRIFGFGAPAQRWQNKFGEYHQTNRWYNGHPVYLKLGGEDLLKMMNDGVWGIGKLVTSYGFSGTPAFKSPTQSTSWVSALGGGNNEPAQIIAQCA